MPRVISGAMTFVKDDPRRFLKLPWNCGNTKYSNIKSFKSWEKQEKQHSNKWIKGFATDFHQEFHQVPPGSTKSPCGLQEDGAISKHKGALSGGDRRLKPKGRSCRGMFPAKVRSGLCQSEGHGKSRFTEFMSKVDWVERCHCRAAAPRNRKSSRHWCRKGLGYILYYL